MRSPKISIIIPVFNGSNYLKLAIDSALGQTYKNIEVIVVDDGSTDGGKTETIAKSYGNKIRYFNKKNGGVASALNFGINEMKGDWFAWLSHDDIYLKNKSTIEAQYIKAHPHIKIFYCNTAVINAEGVLQSSNNSLEHKKIKGGIWYFKTWIYGCSMLIHKDCFKKVGVFDVKNQTVQDVEMTLTLLNEFDFYHLPKILVQRRNHDASDLYRLKDVNIKENDALLLHLLKKWKVNYFFPNLKTDDEDDISIAKCYNELAKYLFVSSPKVADFCIAQSINCWPSLRNQAIYERVIGARVIGRIVDVFYFIRNSFHGGAQKIVNIFKK